MWETSHPLSFAVAGYAIAASIMPNPGPPGIAHLEDPAVLDDLALAQGQLTGQLPADAPMTLAMVVSNRVSGLFACLVLASWRWWLGLGGSESLRWCLSFGVSVRSCR